MLKKTGKILAKKKMENNKKTKMVKKTLAMGILVLSLSLITLSLASATLIYSDTTWYAPSLHTYDIPDSQVGYITIDTRGTSAKESGYITFYYSTGSSYITPAQEVIYLSWTTDTFVNPNPSLTVTRITYQGGSHTYIQNFFAYSEYSGTIPDGEGGEYKDGNGETVEFYCGDGTKNTGEECDNGELNGIECTALYGSSCTYCSDECELETVRGGYCGDGVLQEEHERCDDGNTYDGDKCTSECKKPFQITVEDFEPLVWQCDSRVVYDDGTEPGRVSEDGTPLIERINNYAFEGEQIQWKVLVMDKNGIEKVKDVYVTVDEYIETNCKRMNGDFNIGPNDKIESSESSQIPGGIDPSCNARILEEKLKTFDEETMAYYLCTLTVETPESMYGPVDITVEAEDLNGILGTMDEKEHWYLNPFVELAVEGDLMFDEIRPGTSAYSTMVLVGNDADDGSGVWLDMFISGTDFYDSSSSGAKCPTTNQLELKNFAYYATNGAYSTHDDSRSDAEGYVPIQYGIGFNDPKPFYNTNEILQVNKDCYYYRSNILSPGSEMALIFRLNLPEPCNGDFETGQIYFWGEAI